MPSISATVSVDTSVVKVEQLIHVSVLISNSGAGAINILQVTPVAIFNGDPALEDQCAVSFGVVDLAQGALTGVPAGGNLLLRFGANFHAQSFGGVYNLGCNIYAADGEVVVPAPVAITVQPIFT